MNFLNEKKIVKLIDLPNKVTNATLGKPQTVSSFSKAKRTFVKIKEETSNSFSVGKCPSADT